LLKILKSLLEPKTSLWEENSLFNIGNRRFVGSKQKLADWIVQTINTNCQGDSFFEVFAGTSIISSQMAAQMERVVLNDTLQSNRVIYEAFYGKGSRSQKNSMTIRRGLTISLQIKYQAAGSLKITAVNILVLTIAP
jgi:hypothetical protein